MDSLSSQVCNEIRCQREALFDIIHEDQNTHTYISILAPLFRHVITEFIQNQNRLPTKDDLIWVCSEHVDFDIRSISTLLSSESAIQITWTHN